MMTDYFFHIKKAAHIFLWNMKWEVPTPKKCYLSSRSAFLSNTWSDFWGISNKNILPEIDFLTSEGKNQIFVEFQLWAVD